MHRFCCKSRTTLCFLQQLFATCINMNCWKTGLSVGGKTRFSTSLAAMLQNKLQVFYCPFCFITKNGVCVILPWVQETFLARFPVSAGDGRRCVGLRPTPKIPAAREKPLAPRVASFKSGVKSENDLKFQDEIENWFFSDKNRKRSPSKKVRFLKNFCLILEGVFVARFSVFRQKTLKL